ncbi:MAG: RNA polymerase factor sigma-32 [Proteobacteria bacterium]|jgi:RNA polymerase sigma-32 factor|nr:RNA polymerase factor sigma-32 [Pseudomonadota bacterium]MDA0908074.1 RNA polymerase factor sigma-32 [Pseudomonadota bacterium]NBR38722.1 RNA polymerase factor sigma-32 [Alphaproteobacteria bacterium]
MSESVNRDAINYDNQFIRRVMREDLLERQEELELALAWRDHQDERALHRLVMAYSRLVVSVASKFRHYGLPVGDLIQEGNIGIMQAANRFDPDREVRFSTYSVWWIRASIQDYVLRNWSIVRTGTTSAHKSLFFKLRRLRARIGEADGGALTTDGREQIAESIGVSVNDVQHMEMRMSGADASLNMMVGENSDNSIQDFLVDDRPNPEQSAMMATDAVTLSAWLKDALEDLSDRERVIIQRRRLEEEGSTLEQLGFDFGVSKERIRQLEARAFNKIRDNLERRVADISDLPFMA